ncbi:X8 domain-containing protein [Artemisia annua]|uniref:X8 domain-containing protein n=1 Tax=Artemisia annua TaxID=35608 RepID=A0A2U1NKU3_ARTAN|nr:X8 domain-containing protein [Artemisia annua]
MIIEQDKRWCVSRSQTPALKLQQVLDNVCARLDCKEILPGGSCYAPNNYINHGSYAIDLDYRVNNVCDASYATITNKDPSFGTCVYP